MASIFNNNYKNPGFYGQPGLSIENYRYYCDRINQFYKKFNIQDDEDYQYYLSLESVYEREEYLNKVITNKRNNKIDSILF